jgi:hypothetical protein
MRNEIIIEKMDIKNTILDEIWAKHLVWYGHVQRMDEERKQDGKKECSDQ